MERFDRLGRRGRRGVISLHAVNIQWLDGDLDGWSRAAQRMLAEPTLSLTTEDAEQMIWLDTFGDLIGNTDRHFGNLSFFAEEAKELELTLTPVYDMLPMVFAPVDGNMVDRRFAPRPPNALNLHLWHDAAKRALAYWSRLSTEAALSEGFRRIVAECRETLTRLVNEQSE